MKNRFRVAARVESVAQPFEFLAQLAVVVDLAVEDDNGISVLGRHRLISGIQVYDFQPRGAQRNEIRLVNSLMVRPAMDQGGNRILNAVRLDSSFPMSKTSNSAQRPAPPRDS